MIIKLTHIQDYFAEIIIITNLNKVMVTEKNDKSATYRSHVRLHKYFDWRLFQV